MLTRTPMLNRDDIAKRIPHQGRMCLLDHVMAWTQDFIVCESSSHLAPDHPLRAYGRLGSACAVEYGAQAMAVHGALVAENTAIPNEPSRGGYLASMRNVVLHVDRLDTFQEPLRVRADRLSGDANTVLYSFTVHAGAQPIISGRAAVVLNAAPISHDSAHITS